MASAELRGLKAVSKEVLDASEVLVETQEVGREGVPEEMRRDPLRDACLLSSPSNGLAPG